MSRIQYGTMRLTGWGANMTVEAAEALLLKCVENGITTIDTAGAYSYSLLQYSPLPIFSERFLTSQISMDTTTLKLCSGKFSRRTLESGAKSNL